MKMFKELNMLIQGFISALRTIFWGVGMIILMLTIWSILAVQLIHPINKTVAASGCYSGCPRCPQAFSSVWMSGLTLFQTVVAGDSWGEVAQPIIKEVPVSSLLFLGVIVSVNLSMLNLILAVICDSASQQVDMHQQAKETEQRDRKAQGEMLRMCSSLDSRHTGILTKDEIMGAFTSDEKWADHLRILHMRTDDLEMVMKILDPLNKGELPYRQLVDRLYRMKSDDCQLALFVLVDILVLLCENLCRLKRQIGIQYPNAKLHLLQDSEAKMKLERVPLETTKETKDTSHVLRGLGFPSITQSAMDETEGTVAELQQLVDMFHAGHLDSDEFSAAKASLLGPWMHKLSL